MNICTITVRECEQLHYGFCLAFFSLWLNLKLIIWAIIFTVYEVGFSSLLRVFPVGFLNLQVILDECDFFIFNIIIFIYQWQALLFTTWYARLKAYVILLGHFLYPDLWREKIAIYNLDFILQLVVKFCIIESGIIWNTFRFHSFFLIPFDYCTQHTSVCKAIEIYLLQGCGGVWPNYVHC